MSDPIREKLGEQWAFGFFSALNEVRAATGANGMIGKNTDDEGLVAAFKQVCVNKPYQLLRDAVIDVYRKLSTTQ